MKKLFILSLVSLIGCTPDPVYTKNTYNVLPIPVKPTFNKVVFEPRYTNNQPMICLDTDEYEKYVDNVLSVQFYTSDLLSQIDYYRNILKED